ncbi:sigma 54-interacting transcriptional regulator [Commensalibacter oyaizuii]|uniref:DNA-binding transcriptional regulator NtrC n=1 Tax=Commensalibacter oyaizuii TaxID=3043873 RepID=A0ABT6Q1C7_9PROT|nr:sigma 54-interacting transcriptional regulator [Commensalibacter sp. TBRC 16381]MDI2090284.1 sigma 54-interacting transcriptional regulator [Commensalibacter sp. TBRC 16381]
MVNKTPTILVADDDRSIRTVLKQALIRAKYNVQLTDTATELWEWVCAGKGDVVITDISMPDMNGFEVIPKIKKLNPELPIIVISALSTLSTAVQAEKENVFEYLPKPFDLEKLITTIKHALNIPKDHLAQHSLAEEKLPLVGKSSVMQNIYRMIARLSNLNLSIIISGENGTGKDVVAKALHDYGNKRNEPFLTVNIAALTSEEIEHLLFGTSSLTKDNNGYLHHTSNGTLFLNEIDEMPLPIQTRLFHALEHQNSNNDQFLGLRIICATTKNLIELVQNGKFREDLYYRLNVVPIHLPSLKERIEDIPLLVQYFQKENASTTVFSDTAFDQLKQYHWPGNIRELQNLVTRLSALYPNQTVQDDLVARNIQNLSHTSKKNIKSQEDIPLSVEIKSHIQRYFIENRGLPINKLYAYMIAEVEKPLIELTLAETEGNQIKAATILGINRNTLRKKIKDLNITYKKDS